MKAVARLEKRKMSNDSDYQIVPVCNECGEDMSFFRMVEQPTPHYIYLQFECMNKSCKHYGWGKEYDIEQLNRWVKELVVKQ